MSAQTTYNFEAKRGVAGGLYDLTPHAVDTLLNGAETGTMKFGIGVVTGDKPGVNVALPKTGDTAAKFEGITVNNRTTELDVDGVLHITKGKAIGVMRYGRIFARIAKSVNVSYGDKTYLVITGDDTGCFTNTKGSNAIEIKGRFLTASDNGVAVVELFNQTQEVPA